MTSRYNNLTSQHKDLKSQHNYLTSDGRSMAPKISQWFKRDMNFAQRFHTICQLKPIDFKVQLSAP